MQNKRRRNKSSKFIPNLHNILSDKDSGAIWREDSKSFVLSDLSKMVSNSLPKYFRHSNISSFIRQLNLYGFKRVVGAQIEDNTYYHQDFKKNHVTELKPIRSFYNQQKYGSLRKSVKQENDIQSGQSLQEDSLAEIVLKIKDCQLEHKQIYYRQKIANLERENQRLRLIEQQHIHILNLLNLMPSGFQIPIQGNANSENNLNNNSQHSKNNSFPNFQDLVNYGYNTLNFIQNSGLDWNNNNVAYYIPFSNFQ